jgi:S1-C subfamily serine protease
VATTIFTKLVKRVNRSLSRFYRRLEAYFRRLLFPLYLFPLKLFTYSLYYLLRALGRLVLELLRILLDMVIYPFRSLRNFLKSLFILALVLYIPASMLAIYDYFRRQYVRPDKIVCSLLVEDRLRGKIVRVVGGASEGSGFFIGANQVLTNFHVIDGETSPKVLLSDGRLLTPANMRGDKDLDLAVLYLREELPDLVLPLPQSPTDLVDNEPVLSTGYPWGTDLLGEPTTHRGRFINFRRYYNQPYLQTDITVVPGMSGGPLTDQCGTVIGINTMGVAGLSLFVDGHQAWLALPDFTDADISKIAYDPAASPEEAVRAFYAYIMARQLDKGFDLLSSSYLNWTSLEEWTARFTDILSIDVIYTELVPDVEDTVYIKFTTKTWTGTEVEYHYYQGVWVTVLEDGVYKMNRSKILEITDPSFDWFWSGMEI